MKEKVIDKQQEIKEYYHKLYNNFDIADRLLLKNKFSNLTKDLGCNRGMCSQLNSLAEEKSYPFVPLSLPQNKVEYIFICREPSGGGKPNKSLIGKTINFIPETPKISAFNIMIMAFIKKVGKKSIYVTDISKCAMSTSEARQLDKGKINEHRYYCCSSFLKWEFENLTAPNYSIICVGGINSFFVEWSKSKKLFQKENNKVHLLQFLGQNNIINKPIEKINIVNIPHYALRLAPVSQSTIRLLKNYYNMKDEKEEMKIGLNSLYKYYMNNFCFSNPIKNNI